MITSEHRQSIVRDWCLQGDKQKEICSSLHVCSSQCVNVVSKSFNFIHNLLRTLPFEAEFLCVCQRLDRPQT